MWVKARSGDDGNNESAILASPPRRFSYLKNRKMPVMIEGPLLLHSSKEPVIPQRVNTFLIFADINPYELSMIDAGDSG